MQLQWVHLWCLGAVAKAAAITQLMQFLMALNKVYDGVRLQLLVMDPVPSINKAYSITQCVEKQKWVQMELGDNVENVALSVRGGLRYDKKRFILDKCTQHWAHCDEIWHNKETCFKVHGTPEWYKELVDKRKWDAGGARGFAGEVATSKETQSRPDVNEELL
ncbi:UNVERIFIED_CONTAM: hypothetical protein Sindi_0731100 [Sesamum indicum]